MLKWSFFLLNFILVCHSSIDGQNNKDVLMSIGNSNVSVSEFKYIYEKNNNTLADYSTQSLNEYIDLFTKFKLKVEKAKAMRLDTLSELRAELSGYRKQLANTYLMDKEITETLLKELYERSQSDISFSHIFVALDGKVSTEEKKQAQSKIHDIKSKIVAGMSFEEAAKQYSEDKMTAINGGAMGYFNAPLPDGFYELESSIYSTPVGSVSDIVTTKLGFHIIKVLNKRPARGKISVSHILLPSDKSILADSIYTALVNKADFKDLVKKYSIDKNTVRAAGRLSPFGINTYDPKFEDIAFGLDKINKYSKPVLTKAGWHIIMFNEKVQTDTYDVFVRRMKSLINKDQRFDVAKTKLVEDIKTSAKFSENTEELKKFASLLDEEFYTYKWAPGSAMSNNTLMTLGGKSYSVKDFADYCRKNTKLRLQYDKNKDLAEVSQELYIDFVKEKAMEYEESQLENKYDDFKNLMREYEEGILLFEATKINVWDRANQDTIGLQEFYADKKMNYMRAEMATVREINISGVNQKTAEKIYKASSKTDIIKLMSKFNKKSTVVTFSEKEISTSDENMKSIGTKTGSASSLESVGDQMWRFNQLFRITPERPKTLSEARGFIVADYQEYLEKQWLDELTKEFPVKMNKDVFNSLVKR